MQKQDAKTEEWDAWRNFSVTRSKICIEIASFVWTHAAIPGLDISRDANETVKRGQSLPLFAIFHIFQCKMGRF